MEPQSQPDKYGSRVVARNTKPLASRDPLLTFHQGGPLLCIADCHSLSPHHPMSIREQSVMGHGGRSLWTLAKSLSEFKPGPISHSLLADQVVCLSYFCATPAYTMLPAMMVRL